MTADWKDERDPESIEATARILDPIARAVFRYEMRGLAALPPPPCLLVANHSGAGVVEIPCMLVRWYKQFGEARPGYGLTNRVSMQNPFIAPLLRAIGAVPASYDNARALLDAGKDVLVFPGGDIDSFRPFYQTRKVVFGNRRGYVRLALEAKVPVVPLATIGSHLTYLMMPGNARIAQLLRLKRPTVRLESVPLTMGVVGAAVAVGASAALLVHPLIALLAVGAALAPFPARITTEALPAIDLARALEGLTDPAERIERGHTLIHGALQDAVTRMRHGATR